jgi:hypothetical protein
VDPSVAETGISMGAMQLLSNDFSFDPDGIISSPFPAQKTVSNIWKTTPARAGEQNFTLLFSRQTLDAAAKKLVETPLWAKSMPVTVRAGLGEWKNPSLFFSACGLCLGVLLLLISGLPPRKRAS